MARITKLTPDARIGPYTLVRRLGQGAFAQVWLAVEEGALGFTKQVALKVFTRDKGESGELSDSIRNEIRLCGHLRHPHIVDFYAAGQDGATWYMAMEYIDGTDLRTTNTRLVKADLRWPKGAILHVGLQVARALAHAHQATDQNGEPLGIIHRDLKPANIMLAGNLGVKVTDFGVAKATTNVNVTAVGMFKGTPAYVAPEIWRVEIPTPSSDLFSLGAIIYELTTGRKLLDGADIPAIAQQAIHGDPVLEAATLRDTLPELEPLMRSLLQRDPALRPSGADEVADRIAEVLSSLQGAGDLGIFLKLFNHLGDDAPTPPPALQRTATRLDASWRSLVDRVDFRASEADTAPGVDPTPSFDDLMLRVDEILDTPSLSGEVQSADLVSGPTVPDLDAMPLLDTAPPAEAPSEGLGEQRTVQDFAALPWNRDLGGDPVGGPREPPPPAPLSMPAPRPRAREDEEHDDGGMPVSPALVLISLVLVAALAWVVLSRPEGDDAAALAESEAPELPDFDAPGAASPPEPRAEELPAVASNPSPAELDALAEAEPPAEVEPPTGDRAAAALPAESAQRAAPEEILSAAEEEARTVEDEAGVPLAAADPDQAERPVGDGCLQFVSDPPGARVWVDGAPWPQRAMSKPGQPTPQAAGAWIVGMGIEEAARATLTVELGVGERALVRCDLVESDRCEVELVPGGCPE